MIPTTTTILRLMKFQPFPKYLSLLLAALLGATTLPAKDQPAPESLPAGEHLYVIERDIPNAGKLTKAELKNIALASNAVLKEVGPKIQWLHSYVTGDKLYCVYVAPDAETVREHARKGGFPANHINEVATIFSPASAK